MAEAQKREPFDINASAGAGDIRLPSTESFGPGNLDAMSIDGYATIFDALYKDTETNGYFQALKALTGPEYGQPKAEIMKALGVPPTAFAYSRINYMPDPNAQGILPWPGIAPEALGKIARENVAPQLIIGMRCDDVIRYSNLSAQPWQPGWRLEMADPTEKPGDGALKEMREAERFILNSNIETKYTEARVRDAKRLTGFQRFLAAGTRDWLTYDGLAIWTDTDNGGKVKAYTLLPAGQIRLATAKGYNGDPKNFAVGVDEGGKVIKIFTRDQLTFAVRNPRTNADVSGDLYATGYGLSEIEIAVRLIQGYQNVIDLNVDAFNRSSVPPGILTITGVTQRQLDFINRLWTNIKKGITKKWAMPVIGMPTEKSKIELIDLSKMEGKEGQYKDWMNMLAGAFCTVYRFPVRRFGYRMSGHGKDTEPLPDSAVDLVDEDDPGLAPLLYNWATVINEYILWSRYPHFRLVFTGATPKEDLRRYEARRNAQTWDEARVAAGLKPLADVYDKEHELLAQMMAGAPIDANLSGLYQTIAASYIQSKLGMSGKNEATPGGKMQEKVDPARSAAHGHTAGVRRDSAAESSKS